jgi:hypothetical protein
MKEEHVVLVVGGIDSSKRWQRYTVVLSKRSAVLIRVLGV